MLRGKRAKERMPKARTDLSCPAGPVTRNTDGAFDQLFLQLRSY